MSEPTHQFFSIVTRARPTYVRAMENSAVVADCHAHTVPETLLLELAEQGDRAGGFGARKVEAGWLLTTPEGAQKPLRPGMFSRDLRADLLAGQGIDVQVLSPWLDLQPTATMRPADARAWAGRVNEALVAQAEAAGTRMGGRVPALATVALDDVADAVADLGDCIEGRRMAGLMLSTNPAHCTDLTDSRLEPLWAAVVDLGVPVLLHPPSDGPSRALPGSDVFGNALCRLVDTSFSVAGLVVGGVLDRHPGLRLITVHGGGFLPYQSMRLDGAHRADALARFTLERPAPTAYLRDLYYDTVALAPAAIAFLVATVGAGQVLLGTDHPFPIGDPRPVESVRSAGLSPSDTAAVLGGNLLGLTLDATRA